MSYAAFLESKAQYGALNGFEPSWSPDFLFPFQHALVDWATKASYYRQAVKNLAEAGKVAEQQKLGPLYAHGATA